MGKIVKYCAACDESFAEKFGFCPNCGQEMTAFEMNPVAQAAAVVSEPPKTDSVVEDSNIGNPVFKSSAPTYGKSPIAETVAAPVSQAETISAEAKTEDAAETIDVPTEETPTAPKILAAAAGTNGNGNGNYYQTTGNNFSQTTATEDDDFHLTVIEEKNGKQRNGLLLAAMIVMLITVSVSTVYSLFNKELGVGAIGDDGLFAMVVVDNDPMTVEEPPQVENSTEAGGGGGGGGRKDNEPVSKGTIPPQLRERFLTPSKEDISVTDPTLIQTRATKGPNDIIPKDRSARNGDPNSTNLNPSNGIGPDDLGMGKNGSAGFGENGRDGQGRNGEGGIGETLGSSYGPGGPGSGNPKPPPPAPTKPVVAGVTTKVKILSKPKATYTNEARQNNVTGTVRLRVVFNASGQIGSISPVSGLPYGLTEQAISAARGIKFEPAMKNGVPVTSSVTMEYGFNIY